MQNTYATQLQIIMFVHIFFLRARVCELRCPERNYYFMQQNISNDGEKKKHHRQNTFTIVYESMRKIMGQNI